MIAIDSSVLIDLIGGDARAGAAEDAVRAALTQGPVVACDVVIGEVVAALGSGSVLMDALDDSGIGFAPLDLRSAVRAGEMQRRYKERLRVSKVAEVPRSVPDFLIGAHALMQCRALITRDAGFFRDYFKGLKLIVPKAP
ncbi:MAG: type II toxin-antitoxin system VapC family toxin [Burkholderiaceae bacterium]|nr:MAG: type II toxin-antitoxin system VapC family toxin [Burkholderiaceae bacterium]MCC7285868.1 type II toxin-antitoxin system VapC family toxin [Burkholderiaceae bacterium]